jgi:hypothetical protein
VALKIIMTWDILPNKEQEYFEFVVSEFIPKIKRLGISPVDAWYTMYGDSPQIMVTARTKNEASLDVALSSSDWQRLIDDLLTFVDHFSYKVIPSRSGFQL